MRGAAACSTLAGVAPAPLTQAATSSAGVGASPLRDRRALPRARDRAAPRTRGPAWFRGVGDPSLERRPRRRAALWLAVPWLDVAGADFAIRTELREK